MTKKEMTIEELEKELESIKSAFEGVEHQLREFGRDKSRRRHFDLRIRIADITKKIEDKKLQKIRTDKKTKEEIVFERRLKKLEKVFEGDER